MKTLLALFFLTGPVKGEEPLAEDNEEISSEPDFCVGCDDEEVEEEKPQKITVDIRIDPVTGKIHYIIRGIVVE